MQMWKQLDTTSRTWAAAGLSASASTLKATAETLEKLAAKLSPVGSDGETGTSEPSVVSEPKTAAV